MRALKRRLSDIVYHQMITDARTASTDPGGHSGTTLQSSVTGPDPGSRLFG
jgi:transposase